MTRPIVPQSSRAPATCEGCGKGLSLVEAERWAICLDCTRARHRTVIARGRCHCSKRQQRPGEVVRQGPRAWIPCRRCLGMIEEVTP